MRETSALVGKRIKEARERAGVTQQQLAERLDKTQATISQWEAGNRAPNIHDLIAIATELDLDVAELLPSVRIERDTKALLRATLDRLEAEKLDDQLWGFFLEAEALPALPAELVVASDRPHRAADQLLGRAAEHGLLGTPVDIKALARLCGVHVREAEFDDGLSGLLVMLDRGAAVGVNSRHSKGRQRFTIAHELGHYLLQHHDRFHLDLPAAEAGESPFYDWRLEREANEFAADVLMPASELRDAYQRQKSTRKLAKLFGVSEIAMGYRLLNLGLGQ